MLKRVPLLLLVLLVTVFFPGFAQAKEKVRLAYVEWDSEVATTHLLQAVLQEKMGYEVEILPVAAAAMWQAVGTGNVDALVAAWLPKTHQSYLSRVEKRVENLGPMVNGAKIGWVVPAYVPIDSISQLKAVQKKFDNKIIGIDPGAGLMSLSEIAIKKYNLDMELMEGSGASMTAILANAIKNKKWVVVTGWSPHWKFGKWDLKYLKDPEKVFGDDEYVACIVRKGLKKDMPEVHAFLNSFFWKDIAQFQMVMAWNQEPGADPYKNALRFMNENPDMVKKWLGK